MIITGIQAENVLKYEKLEMNDLPREGVIAVSGHNESGKSSIGETICFALFGRTYSYGPETVDKIIRWGESGCSVHLGFATSDGTGYEIARFLDRDGNHSARLNLLGSEDEPLARGTEAVDAALIRLLGYNFEEFIESFYLAQREISAPHSHSHAVKAMAGLTALDQAWAEFEQEIHLEQDAIVELEPKITELSAEVEDLAIDEGHLPVLESETADLRQRESEIGKVVSEVKAVSDHYQNNFNKLDSTRRGRNIGAVLCVLLFLGAFVAAGGAWLPGMQELRGSAPVYTWALSAIVCAVLFFFSCLGVAVLNGRLNSFEQTSEEFAEKLGALHKMEAAEEGEATQDEGAGVRLREMQSRIAHSMAEPQDVEAVLQVELERVNQFRRERQQRLESLSREIYLEKERLEKHEHLQQAMEAIEEKIDAHLQRIAQRELACELLKGASSHISQHFNRDLRDLVGRTLPLFTDGRYAHLEIDGNLNVRVFSNEKRDFMGMEEISSGTQRQIMLAVRLALSQKLADSIGAGRQFVFLDEPFAFFDQERTRSALAALPRLSDEITQIWVVAQDFPQDSDFDLHVECSRRIDRLEGTALLPGMQSQSVQAATDVSRPQA